MPVFGKGRTNKDPAGKKDRNPQKHLNTEVKRRDFFFQPEEKRRYGPRQYFKYIHTPLFDIKTLLRFDLAGFIHQRTLNTKQPAVVVDWGCGTGRAIEELTDRFKDQVLAYGYSRDSYDLWAISERVKYIQATAEDLPRYLQKLPPIDLIYSYMGYYHFDSKLNRVQSATYLAKLAQKLAPGGMLVFHMCTTGFKFKTKLKRALGPSFKIEDTLNSDGMPILLVRRKYPLKSRTPNTRPRPKPTTAH